MLAAALALDVDETYTHKYVRTYAYTRHLQREGVLVGAIHAAALALDVDSIVKVVSCLALVCASLSLPGLLL